MNDFIQREDIKFWLPIFTIIVSVTVWGMTLSSQIQVISTKIDAFDVRITKNEDKGIRMAQVLNEWAARLVKVETKLE
jgi:hypothetical protein